ncbi:MAG TPA: inner membrane CreD family protein [Blastocatellia bacterium]|nr:inner membrane CreD family protein [Blastocatellia bacterium]
MVKRIFAIGVVYFIATAGWMILGSAIIYRTDNQDALLKREVGELWGVPLEQRAPAGSLAVEREVRTEKYDPAQKKRVVEKTTVTDRYDVPLTESDIRVNLELDQRQKGLLWYSTYRVRFSGSYWFENTQDKGGELTLSFSFPAANGLYDDFKFEVDGKPVPFVRQDSNLLVARVRAEAKSRHLLAVNYYSHGLDRFVYRFGNGISEVRNFRLVATTDFDSYDHPGDTLSPNMPKERAGSGWQLTWSYKDLISGNGIGIEMPQKINPGPMAARISFFAPVSLGFFFFLIFLISMLRGVDIHPMNYFFLAAAFFAFHLLLAYLVDHISIHAAFVICSAVSIFLVISYMRLVVCNRFAWIETGLSQFIYLIGFSYAFFFDGFTGLTVTIGSIVTLFVVMQMTAKINWSEKFRLGSSNGTLAPR